jgi:hypothetical protein
LYGRFSARAFSGFTDQVTFSSEGREGQEGVLRIAFVFERSLRVQGAAQDSYASATASFSTNWGSAWFNEVYSLQPSGCNPASSSPCSLATVSATGGTIEWSSPSRGVVSLPIVFGQEQTIQASIDMIALANYYEGSSQWTADAANSFYWGGIQSVEALDGSPVDFTIASASGTNYLVSQVPEPATYVSLSLGLAALLAVRRRRQ